MSDIESGTLDTPKDIGDKPEDIVKRWALEIDLASKAERDWRECVEKIWDRYRGTKQKKNSFNILWSITETMRPAIYNTMPKPDVRRRFRDDDKVGKWGSEVIERSVAYSIDVYDFDGLLQQSTLDVLLPGRAVDWVRYVPSFEDVGYDESEESEEDPKEESREVLKGESVICEHVQWDDFRHGPGKTWAEVKWVARKHVMTRDMLKSMFGEIGESVPLDDIEDEQIKKSDNKTKNLFKTLTVWEIYDKDKREALFIAPSYKESPLKNAGDPLGLQDFFPCPRPFYAIEDSSSLIPVPFFEEYRQQADELDRISKRINILTDALKLRGVYNSTIGEMERLMRSEDNDLIASKNTLALAESGGLDKHIWFMPIDKAAMVIKVLIEQREACKQVIYELTGIADIMRGASDPRETASAQKMKGQWGTQRLQRLQRELQRYARDLIRLKAEVICNKFQPETLIDMTGIKLLHQQEKMELQQQAQAFAQYQQQMQQAQQHPPPQGQPPQGPQPHPGMPQ